MNNITWRESKGKFVITKEGVNIALTPEQLQQFKLVIKDIEGGGKEFYKKDTRND